MKPGKPVLQSARLLDQVRERIRYMHYSLSTETTYLYWVKFFIRWHGRNGLMRHPREMAGPEIEAFLTMLATERKVSTSTHNQALSALLFLYREVLGLDLPWLEGINRPTAKRRIPSVLTRDEVAGVLAQMDGVTALLARLLYGTGMRLMEGIRLRVKDVDFDRHVIIVREAKGGKDRVVMLTAQSCPSAAITNAGGARAVGGRSTSATRWGRNAARAGGEIPQSGSHLGLVLDVSVAYVVDRPAQWCRAATSFI